MNLADFLRRCVPLWGTCYATKMEIVNYPAISYQQVGASGGCPHCGTISYFKPVTAAHSEVNQYLQTLCNAVQCEACKNFALVVGIRNQSLGNIGFTLKAFYPLGRPNDAVDPAVPKEIAAKGLITEPLRQFAHEVRLEGNDGAHPDPDGLENVTPKDADDIIEFTREYLHHVYVMPAKLAARKGAAAPVAPVGP